MAYVCLRAKGPYGTALLAVSVRDLTLTPAVGISRLRKMVAAATRPPSRSSVRASALVPPIEANPLRTAFGGSVPLPSTMAKGFIITRAFVQDRSAYFPRTAYAVFGRDGRRLSWTVAPTGHGIDDRCTRTTRRSYRAAVINGRSVYLIRGAKGQAAWIFVSEPKRITVELWNDYSVGARTLMRVVASAHP